MSPVFAPGLDPIPLPADQSWPASVHQFDDESIWAIRAALAAQRPLLIRGEPGIGKSQLARAAAEVLKAPFLSHVVHERCEVGDLLYSVDAVSRLAQAQIAGALGRDGSDWKERLDEKHFIRPGVLWRALNWDSASKQTEKYFRKLKDLVPRLDWNRAEKPCVVLIDEIDKADTAVPNALLETLGNLGFQVPEIGESVARDPAALPPLVIITTNEERELPAAFLRRCFVLHMPFPSDRDKARDFLIKRARVHFTPAQVPDDVCDDAIRLLLDDRAKTSPHGLARPGAAELLDLLRALHGLHPEKEAAQRTALAAIKNFALCKNPAEENR